MEKRCAELNEADNANSRERELLAWRTDGSRKPSMFPRTAMSMAAALVALGTFLSMQAE